MRADRGRKRQLGTDRPAVLKLTRSGRLAGLAGFVSMGAGRAAGISELSIMGSCLLLLVAGSWLTVRIAGSDLAVRRTVRPHRIEVGESFNMSIQVHNGRSFLRLPLLASDRLDGRPTASLTLPQRRIDPAVDADYTQTATRRGLTTFGPISVSVLDPFAFARCDTVVSDLVDVIVLPRIHPLSLQRSPAAADPTGGLRHRRQLNTVSDEFDALREYAPGDDVRRVHWASTARMGRPMVRMHQQPSQHRTTVVLDDRASSYPPLRGDTPFERSVSAAASALVACREAGELVRLLCASGSDTGLFDDRQRLDSVLDQLAATSTREVGSLQGALATAAAGGGGERVIVCSGRLHDEDLAAVARSASRGGEHVVVTTGAALDGGVDVAEHVQYVDYSTDAPLDHAWREAARDPRTSAAAHR